jgi:predicted phage replisome organizer
VFIGKRKSQLENGGGEMSEIKWIKITTDIFANRKIKQIMKMPDSDAIIVIWFNLLCLAGEVNEKGLITLTPEVPYTDEMLANEFGKPLTTVRMSLKIFEQFKMIEIIDNIYCISNWEKYQNIDKLEDIKEKNRLRVAKHREKVKLLASQSNVNVTLPVMQSNAVDLDLDQELDQEKDLKTTATTDHSNQKDIKDVADVVDLDNDTSELEKLRARILGNLFPSGEDLKVMDKMLKLMPFTKLKPIIENANKAYKPKFKGDKIRTFSYFLPIVQQMAAAIESRAAPDMKETSVEQTQESQELTDELLNLIPEWMAKEAMNGG